MPRTEGCSAVAAVAPGPHLIVTLTLLAEVARDRLLYRGVAGGRGMMGEWSSVVQRTRGEIGEGAGGPTWSLDDALSSQVSPADFHQARAPP